jgi:uncharacterized protein
MKENKALKQPPSEQELNWLADYLDELSKTYPDTMSLEKLDGFFCALIVNPILVEHDDWLNFILDENFEFPSDKEAEKFFTLIFRHWNHISRLIKHPPKTKNDELYMPCIEDCDENTTTHKLAERWALGFREGMEFCFDEWEKLFQDEDNYHLIVPVMLLQLGRSPEQDDRELSFQEREDLFIALPSSAYALYTYWQDKTKQSKEKKTKIGRNDPCPCGSGKKYKKCCEGQQSSTVH